MSGPTTDPPRTRVYLAKAAPADGFTWRPIQRSTRFVVFIALGVTAEGLQGSVKAVVQRVVPRVGGSQTDVKSDHLKVVMVPRNSVEVAGLVPGLRFTGSIDTGTGGPDPKPLVHLGN